jgi:hypothetical protein
LIVTGAVPEEVRVIDCVVGVLSTTSPNAMLVALMVRASTAAFNCRRKLLDRPPELALMVTALEAVTEDTVAVKPALVAFAGTVTEPGTVTAESLLVRFMIRPPLGAAAVNVTVQASVPDPVMVALLQESALNAAVLEAAVPVPLRVITAVLFVDELLEMVS